MLKILARLAVCLVALTFKCQLHQGHDAQARSFRAEGPQTIGGKRRLCTLAESVVNTSLYNKQYNEDSKGLVLKH